MIRTARPDYAGVSEASFWLGWSSQRVRGPAVVFRRTAPARDDSESRLVDNTFCTQCGLAWRGLRTARVRTPVEPHGQHSLTTKNTQYLRLSLLIQLTGSMRSSVFAGAGGSEGSGRANANSSFSHVLAGRRSTSITRLWTTNAILSTGTFSSTSIGFDGSLFSLLA